MKASTAQIQVEPAPAPKQNVTMGGRQATRLFRGIKADWVIPMHYETWDHFTQYGDEPKMDFQAEGVLDRVKWMKKGKAVKVLEAESRTVHCQLSDGRELVASMTSLGQGTWTVIITYI